MPIYLVRQTSLQDHTRSYNNVRVFPCEFCKFSFFHKNVLKKHTLRKHTNDKEKQINCPYSDFRFWDKGELKRLKTRTFIFSKSTNNTNRCFLIKTSTWQLAYLLNFWKPGFKTISCLHILMISKKKLIVRIVKVGVGMKMV